MTSYVVAEAFVPDRGDSGGRLHMWRRGRDCHSRQRDHAACLLVPAYVAT